MKSIKELFIANKVGLKYIFKHHWPLIVLEFAYAIISGFLAYLTSYMTKAFTNIVVESQSLRDAMFVVIFVTMYIFVKNVTQNLMILYSKYVYAKTRKTCRIAFVEELKKINLSFFDIPENKSVMSRAEQYALSGTEQLVTHIFYCFSNFVACVSVLYLMSPFSWWIVLILIALMSYKVIIDSIIAKRNFNYKKEKVNRDRRTNYFSNIFKGANTLMDLHMYHAHGLFVDHYEDASEENISLQAKHDKINTILTITSFMTLIIQNI